MERCCACSKEFVNGDLVITFYFEQVKPGEKSGMLGFYEHGNSPEGSVDHVHFNYSCLEKCFSPVDNPFLYDSIVDSIRKEIWEDENDIDPDSPIFDFNEDPPPCLWCKREDTVWVHFQRDMTIFNCMFCRKLWDDNEDELTWDPVKGVYKHVEYYKPDS